MSEKTMLFTDDICRAAWMQMHKLDMTPVLKDGKVMYRTVKTDKSLTRFNLYSPKVRDAVGEFGKHMIQLIARGRLLIKQQKAVDKKSNV